MQMHINKLHVAFASSSHVVEAPCKETGSGKYIEVRKKRPKINVKRASDIKWLLIFQVVAILKRNSRHTRLYNFIFDSVYSASD